jgi:hypothetical protein
MHDEELIGEWSSRLSDKSVVRLNLSASEFAIENIPPCWKDINANCENLSESYSGSWSLYTNRDGTQSVMFKFQNEVHVAEIYPSSKGPVLEFNLGLVDDGRTIALTRVATIDGAR